MKYAQTIAVAASLLIAVSGAGCSSVGDPANIKAFLKPYQVDVTAKDYVLQPPDEIEIRCSKVPEIHLQKQQIRPDGKVSFEALGEIEVAGKTIEQVSNELRTKVLDLYKLVAEKPIDVRITIFRSKVYYVLGQVYLAGPKEYTGRDTVLTALAGARINAMAWEQRVRVIRPSNDENIEPKIFKVNYKHMRELGDTSKDVLLQEGDIVYVPPTILAAIAMVIEEFVRPIGSAFSTVNVVSGTPGYR